MLASTWVEKEKTVPEGEGIDFDGNLVRRQRGMIYWYRWGRHTFDIRIVRKILGLPERHEADNYFMKDNSYYKRDHEAFVDIFAQVRAALGGKSFKQIIKEHDVVEESGQ